MTVQAERSWINEPDPVERLAPALKPGRELAALYVSGYLMALDAIERGADAAELRRAMEHTQASLYTGEQLGSHADPTRRYLELPE